MDLFIESSTLLERTQIQIMYSPFLLLEVHYRHTHAELLIFTSHFSIGHRPWDLGPPLGRGCPLFCSHFSLSVIHLGFRTEFHESILIRGLVPECFSAALSIDALCHDRRSSADS